MPKQTAFDKEFKRVHREHPRLPVKYAKVVAQDHLKVPKGKRD